MQVQVIDISAYHCVEGDPTSLVVNPIIVELGLVNRADYVADVLIVVFQQHHELVPILMLVVLKFYPQVVVLGVVGNTSIPISVLGIKSLLPYISCRPYKAVH